MKTVRRLLQSKDAIPLAIVSPETTVFDALTLMAEKDVGALLVIERDNLVGIVTERDYARKVALEGKDAKKTPISAIMTSKVLYMRPNETVEDCMALMTQKHLRHLPVVDDEDRLIGIVSIRDVIADVISEKQFLIEQLEHYIMDRRPHL